MKKRWLAIGLSICLTMGMLSGLNIRVFAEEEVVSSDSSGEEGNTDNIDNADGTINGNTGDVGQVGDGISEDNSAEPSGDEAADPEADSTVPQEESEAPAEPEKVTPVELQIMDENGNITYIMDDVSPVAEEPSMNARTFSSSGYVVNLRAKKNGTVIPFDKTTEFDMYGTGDRGYVHGDSGTDAAYLGTENGKVKFMISGIIGMVPIDAVQVVDRSGKQLSSYYVNGTYLFHKVSQNLFSDKASSSIKQGYQPSYLTAGTTYFSYDGHYFYTDYSVMLSDYTSNTRKNAVNAANPYYNYFQYLPFRSTTIYSASQLSSKINTYAGSNSKMWNLGNSLINNQNTYGVNALLMAGLAANESGWGKSSIALNKNNIFSLNAVDSSPGASANTFNSPDECVKTFAEIWMSKGYLDTSDGRYFGGFLGNKASGVNVKYASDPYWGEKAAAIAWNLDGEGKEQGRYTIGIKDIIGTTFTLANVMKSGSSSSGKLFNTGNQTTQSFLILGEENGFYKIQTDPVLNAGRTGIDTSTGKYNFSSMYGYLDKNYITLVSNSANQTPVVPSPNNPDPTEPEVSGADTLVVRRGNTYYFKYSLSEGEADLTVPYGRANDQVLIGDWDGDGIDSLCVRRGNVYYFKNSLAPGEADYVVKYGRASDEVLVGDWDGDGKDTLCVRRGNTYYLKNSLSDGEADVTVLYGRSADIVLVGDWNGDGTDTLCVRRGSTYYFKNSLSNGEADATIPYGRAGDQILAGDWNGDNVDTLCVRRGNAYHIKNSISEGAADKVILYGRSADITYAGTWKK
jgi:beta-N-acetylglucosaminidase